MPLNMTTMALTFLCYQAVLKLYSARNAYKTQEPTVFAEYIVQTYNIFRHIPLRDIFGQLDSVYNINGQNTHRTDSCI